MSVLAPSLQPEQKSTTVRPDFARVPSVIRAAFQLASRLVPSIAALVAEYVFFRPHVRSSKKVAAAATRARLRIGKHDIVTYIWGEGGSPAVLLLHGWEGSAGQMAPLARALAADGHRVVAVDLPAHGDSSGAQTNLPEVAGVIAGVTEELGPFATVVGHSFGAVAAMLVAKDLAVDRVVTIGGPASLAFVVESFAVAVGLEGVAHDRFRGRLERRFGAEMWRRFSPSQIASDLSVHALVVHDTDDRAVPHDQAEALVAAWSGAQLFSTDGLGHYRVLRSPEVHQAIVRFLHHGVSL